MDERKDDLFITLDRSQTYENNVGRSIESFHAYLINETIDIRVINHPISVAHDIIKMLLMACADRFKIYHKIGKWKRNIQEYYSQGDF